MSLKYTVADITSRARKGRDPREAQVARLWRDYAHTLKSLTTSEGKRLRVLYPGRPSSEAGPDFRDALLITQDGQFLQGDVEVHLRPRDWRGHGHHRDQRYNGVVLHAVLWPGEGQTFLETGALVPVVVLRPLLGRRSTTGSPAPGEVPPLSWFHSLSQEELGHLLGRVGDQRFLEKSRRYANALPQESHDQVLYSALLDALATARTGSPSGPWPGPSPGTP